LLSSLFLESEGFVRLKENLPIDLSSLAFSATSWSCCLNICTIRLWCDTVPGATRG